MRNRMFAFGRFWERIFAGGLLLAIVVAMYGLPFSNWADYVPTSTHRFRMVPLLNLWTLEKNQSAVDNKFSEYWDGGIFFPHTYTLSYSEPQLLFAVLSRPIRAFGVSPVVQYNVLLVGNLWITGMAMFLFVSFIIRRLWGGDNYIRFVGAVLSAVCFVLSPYFFREISVLQLLAVGFPILMFWFALSWLWRPSWLRMLGCVLSFAASWYACAYYGMFATILLAPAFLVFGYRLKSSRHWFHLCSAICAAAVIVAPLIRGFLRGSDGRISSRAPEVIRSLSARADTYFGLPREHVLVRAGLFAPRSRSSSDYLGAVTYILGGIGIALSVRRVYAVCLRRPLNVISRRYSTRLLAYLGLGLSTAVLLSFGPTEVRPENPALGASSWIYFCHPYNALYELVPGFDSIRSASRFSVFAGVFLYAFAGGVLKSILLCRYRLGRALIVGGILLAVYADATAEKVLKFRPGTRKECIGLHRYLETNSTVVAVLELPLGQPEKDPVESIANLMFVTASRGIKYVNGYSGFSPDAYRRLCKAIDDGTDPETVLAAVRAFGTSHVVVRKRWSSAIDALCSEWKVRKLVTIAYESQESEVLLIRNSEPATTKLSIRQLNFGADFAARERYILAIEYSMPQQEWVLFNARTRRLDINLTVYDVERGHISYRMAVSPASLLVQNRSIYNLPIQRLPPGKYRLRIEHCFDKERIVSETNVVINDARVAITK